MEMATNNSLWVEKYRPGLLNHYVGNEHLKGIVERYLEENDIQNLIGGSLRLGACRLH